MRKTTGSKLAETHLEVGRSYKLFNLYSSVLTAIYGNDTYRWEFGKRDFPVLSAGDNKLPQALVIECKTFFTHPLTLKA